MELSECLSIWDELTPAQQELLQNTALRRTIPKGTLLHNGNNDCQGLVLLCSGVLRAFIMSDEGREVTLYRLVEGDVCLFSASCMLQSIQFDISIEAEQDSALWVIPTPVYKQLTEQSLPAAHFTNEIMSARFSEVMWLIEQIMWKSFDKRLASFLIDESALEDTMTLKITHERIANHMGTAREVVTRMLRYFQQEGLVELSRGTVTLTDHKRLLALQADD